MTIVAFIWHVDETATKICLQVMDLLMLGFIKFFFLLTISYISFSNCYNGTDWHNAILVFYNYNANSIPAMFESIAVSTEPISIFLLSIIFIGEIFSILKMTVITIFL